MHDEHNEMHENPYESPRHASVNDLAQQSEKSSKIAGCAVNRLSMLLAVGTISYVIRDIGISGLLLVSGIAIGAQLGSRMQQRLIGTIAGALAGGAFGAMVGIWIEFAID